MFEKEQGMIFGGVMAVMGIVGVSTFFGPDYEPVPKNQRVFEVDIGKKGMDLVTLTKSDSQPLHSMSYEITFYPQGSWKVDDGIYSINGENGVSLDERLEIPIGYEARDVVPADGREGFIFPFYNQHRSVVPTRRSPEYRP